MAANASIATKLMQHCLGVDEPSKPMLRTGRFAEGWVEKFLLLIEEAKREYASRPAWPRELVAAAYHACVYSD